MGRRGDKCQVMVKVTFRNRYFSPVVCRPDDWQPRMKCCKKTTLTFALFFCSNDKLNALVTYGKDRNRQHFPERKAQTRTCCSHLFAWNCMKIGFDAEKKIHFIILFRQRKMFANVTHEVPRSQKRQWCPSKSAENHLIGHYWWAKIINSVDFLIFIYGRTEKH